MKSKLFDILLLLFLFMAVLSSCGERDYPHDEEIMVSFSFSTQENMTRAGHDWDDNLDNDDANDYDVVLLGSDYDSRIKFNSLRAFIYDNSGDFVCEITNRAYFELSKDIYRFLGGIRLTSDMYEQLDVDEDGVVDACKVMLVANSTFLDEDPAKFSTTTFSVDNLKMPNGFIPMWGVTTATLNFQPNQDLGNIYLLRSAAKVEIKLSQSLIDEGIKIEDAFINKHAPNGYLFPTGWNSVGNTVSLSHSGCYNPIDVSNTPQYFTKSSDSEVVIYLPEMETKDADITIHVKKGDEIFQFANAIKFANYDNNGDVTDEKFNIVRNHHYQYTITSVNIGASLKLKCNVLDWEEDLEEWEYSDVPMVSTNNGHINWTAGVVNGNRVNLTPSAPYATFTFGLEAPVGASWHAEFVTIKGKQKAFKFTQGNNASIATDGSFATGTIGKFVSLTISTTGSADVENNEVYLRIYVILPNGNTIRVSSMLHKDENSEYVIVQTP